MGKTNKYTFIKNNVSLLLTELSQLKYLKIVYKVL